MTHRDKSILAEAQNILTKLRIASPAEGFVVSLAAHAPGTDCSEESYSVGVMWNGQVFSGHAIDFANAVGIARSKIAAEKERLSRDTKERAKARQKTAIDKAHTEVAA